MRFRYTDADDRNSRDRFVLGWTEIDAEPKRVPDRLSSEGKVAFVDEWAKSRRSLLMALQSAVLPEADIVLMNTLHPAAAGVNPLTTRPFHFGDCLHRPPMLDRFGATKWQPSSS